ncbi:hypothetical protein C8Q79DRAFT_909127 [Trametes meyenii]|nr:hypothetical protein C8Q79DRAFT_909127 [Trametes meyenii]
MHSVSVPAHQFSRYAETYLQTETRERNRALLDSLQSACRSYTRVVLRLRAQAEAEARAAAITAAQSSPTSPARGRGLPSVRSTTSVNSAASPKKEKAAFSRSTSRAPSPTSSHGHSYHAYHARTPSTAPGAPTGGGPALHSPLFRIRRAPLLQVFVPSPEGDWLSDASVLACERELRRAGVGHVLRPGDVVWDAAVGDEGNMGRMVWDGGYLIDLDYSYSRAGDLPRYLPTLAFPPSYFHRVVRTMGAGNPVCHIDVAPWGEEIAANLQLIQDRVRTETPQGGHHMVVRWVHRSSFTLRPPAHGKPLRLQIPRDVGIGPGPGPGGAWFVDPGWYGTVVVEAEGTNEGLADLQARCRGAFPPRALGVAASLSPERAAREAAQRGVFRILREKSRPGEIWIRTVTSKERLLPP